jgi:lactocepin
MVLQKRGNERMKKKIALMAAVLMTSSNLVSAQGALSSQDKATGQKPQALSLKKSGQEKNYKQSDKVRVAIEMEQKPAIQIAQAQNKRYSTLSNAEKESIKDRLVSVQKSVKSAIAKKAIPVTYKESFTTVINGFSGEVKFGDIEDIKQLDGVKSVHIAHEYARPTVDKGAKPDMLYSKDMVNAKETWQDYGIKGEGTVVAVIDTGIDPSHKDMVLSPETKVDLTSSKVESTKETKGLKGKYFTEKVPYGYNYADHDSEIRHLGAGASMHGMHVAGTVGANGDEANGGIKGVAPETQLLAMKVFGNDPGMPSTFSDIYIKAIDDAIALGADVINISLGSTASFVNADDPEQRAIVNAMNNGILCAISAGNSAFAGHGAGNPYKDSPNPIAVFDKEKKDVVYVGDGQASNYEGKDVKGKVVFVVRTGDFNYSMIQAEAEKQGAAGVIVRGKVDHGDYVSMALNNPTIPLVTLSIADGNDLEAKAKEGKAIAVTFDGKAVSTDNPVAGQMSDFTSWGVTPSLDFKPEITAPGGKIYSTLNDNEYGVMSGTSMAAPHVAGGTALVMQLIANDFKVTGATRVKLAKNILMNTSRPQLDQGKYNAQLKTGNLYSPRREGAGLMDLRAAMKTPVVITETKSGEGKASLKEVGEKFTFTLDLKNYSNEKVTYKLAGTVQSDLGAKGSNFLEANGIFKKGTIGTVDANTGTYPISFAVGSKKASSVSINPKSSTKVSVSVDLKNTTDWANELPLEQVFKNGYFVEGFVRLIDTKSKSPELTVPYVGFKGKWDQAPILDAPLYDKNNTFYGLTGLATEVKDDFEFLGTNAAGKVVANKVSFSPNNDGSADEAFPIISFLRNAKKVEYSILDRNKTTLQKLDMQTDVVKNYYDSGSEDAYTPVTSAAWDGTINGKPVKDGLYYYKVKSVIDYPNAKWQTNLFPVYVDTKKPAATVKWDAAKSTLSWTAGDQGTGVASYDILVNGKSVLKQPLAAPEKAYTLTDLPERAKIAFVVKDYAGNSVKKDVNTTGVDKAVPNVQIDTPVALGLATSKVINIAGHVSDESGIKSFKINGKTVKLRFDAAQQN